MTNTAEIDFFCVNDKVGFIKIGDQLVCPKCNRIIYKQGPVYDFYENNIMKNDLWDIVFVENDASINIFKKIFDKLLWVFLPGLLNNYLVSYIIAHYPKNARLVELGCGRATVSKALLEKRSYSVVLVDANNFALKKAVENLWKEDKLTRCVFVKSDFYNEELCFSENYFDVSFNNGVIEHFSDPVKAIKRMKKLAKRVICVVPAKSIYFKIGTVIRKIIEKDAALWTKHTKYYTQEELKLISLKARLKNVEVKTVKFLNIPLCHFLTGT